MTSDCVFCAIAAGESEASIVAEDERAVAFMDIDPASDGHVLVAPRGHADMLADLGDEDAVAVFRLAQRAAPALRASVAECEGVNLYVTDGEAAGQTVFHAHVHVIPRRSGDGLGFRAPGDRTVGRDRQSLDRMASRLREVLA